MANGGVRFLDLVVLQVTLAESKPARLGVRALGMLVDKNQILPCGLGIFFLAVQQIGIGQVFFLILGANPFANRGKQQGQCKQKPSAQKPSGC